jgi:hypothetical protein
MADVLTELSIGYPKSPLNGGGEYAGAGPKEGERVRLTQIIRTSELETRRGLRCMPRETMEEGRS